MKKKGFKLSKLTKGLLTIVMSMGICLPIHALASDGNASAQIDDYEPPEIVSIEMNKAGESLHVGDTVHFVVKAADNLNQLNPDGTIVLASPVSYSDISVALIQNEETGLFEGDFTVDEFTDISEWYVCDVSISDTNENTSRLDIDQQYIAERDNYFYVGDLSEIEFPSYDLEMRFRYLDEDGEYNDFEETVENVSRRSTLKEAGIKLPDEIPYCMDGISLKGWVDDFSGEIVDEEMPILSSTISFGAFYDKSIVSYSYTYPDENEYARTTEKEYMFVENGSTYRQVESLLPIDQPEDLYKNAVFDKWKIKVSLLWVDGAADLTEESGMMDDSIPLTEVTEFSMYADFEGKVVVPLEQVYFNDKGMRTIDLLLRVVDYGMPLEDWFELEINDKRLPSNFDGLRFSNWYFSSEPLPDEIIDEEYDYAYYNGDDYPTWRYTKGAVYENYLIAFMIDDDYEIFFGENADWGNDGSGSTSIPMIYAWDEKPEHYYAMVVEPGEMVTIPDLPQFKDEQFRQFDDYWSLYTGVLRPGDQVTVDGHTAFVGTGIEQAVDPIEPEDPSKDELSDMEIADVLGRIEASDAHDSIIVEMDDAVILPKEILEAARASDITLVVKLNGYQWTIYGSEISDGELKDINLEVIFHANNIPSSLVNKIAANQTSMQISLTHAGEFGFDAWLTVNVGEEHSGKNGSLYYYDGDDLDYQSSSIVEKNGDITLKFSHASDYLIVIEEAKTSDDKPSDDVPTSTTMSIALWGMCMLFAAGTMTLLKTRKQQ